MTDALEAVRLASTIGFVLLAVLAVVQWLRRRGAQTAWLAATFAILGAVVVGGRLLPDVPETGAEQLGQKLLIACLVLFPYFLYRFTAAFGVTTRRLDLVAAVMTGIVVGYTFLLPRLPAAGEPRPREFQIYVLVLLVQWVFLLLLVAAKLWGAGSGQPTVARRRMRLLGLGAILMAVALLIAGLAPSSEEPTAVQFVTQILAIASAVVFYMGFALPGLLRVSWRRPEEEALRQATMDLMTSITAKEVSDILLPHVVRIVGARSAVLAQRDGTPIATHGVDLEEGSELVRQVSAEGSAGQLLEGREDTLALAMRSGVLVVQSSPFTPFFGREEIDLMRGIGAFADLALERADLFEREREAREAVEEANEELESFVYSVSHDLKSPLISVLGYLDLLKMDVTELGERGDHYVGRISASAMYMNRLILDLLELSRIGRVQTEEEEVDLDAVLDEIAGELRPAHPSARFEFKPMGVVVLMNPLRARQLFTNLVGNAVTHGGRPDITVGVESEPGPYGSVRIVVRDDGKGIPATYHEKVFGVFERLDGPGESPSSGTGIGLAVCKKIVEQAGGTITLGFPEVGTEFDIVLPARSVRTGATT